MKKDLEHSLIKVIGKALMSPSSQSVLAFISVTESYRIEVKVKAETVSITATSDGITADIWDFMCHNSTSTEWNVVYKKGANGMNIECIKALLSLYERLVKSPVDWAAVDFTSVGILRSIMKAFHNNIVLSGEIDAAAAMLLAPDVPTFQCQLGAGTEWNISNGGRLYEAKLSSAIKNYGGMVKIKNCILS